MQTQGYICSHVDDFIISGNEQCEEWCKALEDFHGRFRWSPWEAQSFLHCGIRLREELDFSFSLDHSTFCENIEQITYEKRADHERVTDDELTQLRGVLGALQWRSHQTAPHLASRLGQLQSEISKATVGTLKAANRLVRECFQTRHLSTRINQLDVLDPKDVCFVAWSDAALANRVDFGSTGGFLVAAANPCILRGEPSPLSLISWRSGKLGRKSRSSLSAEAQALSEADQELMFVRLAWSELCGIAVDLRKADESISKISGTVVIDAKSLFDVLEKRELNSAAVGLKDKYSALEVLCLLESIERLKTGVRWVHSDAQLADAMTKPLPPGILHKVLHDGKWTLCYDPNFTSAKKLKASQRAKSFQNLRDVSVVESCQPQIPTDFNPLAPWPKTSRE